MPIFLRPWGSHVCSQYGEHRYHLCKCDQDVLVREGDENR